MVFVLFDAFHGGLCHGGHDRWPTAETFAKSMRPVADLADVYRDIGVFRRGCDGELKVDEGRRGKGSGGTDRVPLESRYFRNLDEEPLSGCVLEARFDDAKLHCTAWVNEDL